MVSVTMMTQSWVIFPHSERNSAAVFMAFLMFCFVSFSHDIVSRKAAEILILSESEESSVKTGRSNIDPF